jgi:hypothetical protein
MSDFEKRLEKAIQRGQRASDARAQAEAEKALTEQELRRLHTQYRLELSEHIENCLGKLPQYLPGFLYETVVTERGWGAAVSRDDIDIEPGRGRRNYFSRLEVVIRPLNSSNVLEMAAKATVRDREIFNRVHYQRMTKVDQTSFNEVMDLWILEFAELYSAAG